MPIEQRQQTLFATEQHEDDRWLWASLVERLSGRLGEQAVLRARLRSEHQPEYAWTETPWLDASLSRASPPARRRPGTISNPTTSAPSLVTTRPLHLERRPIAVRMIALSRNALHNSSHGATPRTPWPGAGDPSGLRPAGGAVAMCDAITTESRRPLASGSGCFVGSTMEHGSCMDGSSDERNS